MISREQSEKMCGGEHSFSDYSLILYQLLDFRVNV